MQSPGFFQGPPEPLQREGAASEAGLFLIPFRSSRTWCKGPPPTTAQTFRATGPALRPGDTAARVESHGTNVIHPSSTNPQLLRFATVQLSNAAEKPVYAAPAPRQQQESEAAESESRRYHLGASRALPGCRHGVPLFGLALKPLALNKAHMDRCSWLERWRFSRAPHLPQHPHHRTHFCCSRKS